MISTPMMPFRKRYQLDTCYFLSLTSMLNLSFPLLDEMHNFYFVSQLFDTRSFSIRMSLKWPLSRDSQFKIHSYLGWWKTKDRAKVSTSPLSKKPRINSLESQGTRWGDIQKWRQRNVFMTSSNYLVNNLFLWEMT